MRRSKLLLWAGIPIVLLAGVWLWRLQTPIKHPAGEIALLLPDDIDVKTPLVRIWEDAAREEGLRLVLLRDSEFLRPSFKSERFAGLILPDSLHPIAGDALVQALNQYVQEGGKMMLTYDAATWQRQGLYRPQSAALSSLVGVEYALYTQLTTQTMRRGALVGTSRAFQELEMPPGKTLPYTQTKQPRVSVTGADFQPVATSKNAADEVKLRAVCAYSYPVAQYSGFVTQGRYTGKTLLTSPDVGLMAGYRPIGKGGVLFVNMPLGYLKSRTDGIFLHSFLRYFSNRVLEVVRTTPVPDGVGGVTMNWHVDSNADIKPLSEMKRLGFFDQGPYSVHFTAGPDMQVFGDKLGLNISGNPAFQNVMRDMMKRGYNLGSHGGWIHNYYGEQANENNKAQMLRLLKLNKQAVEAVTKTPTTEYSAPEGNQPIWSTDWLDAQGVKGYYFTGNTGLGPTRSFRVGQSLDVKAWSFPIATFGVNASFAEFAGDKLSDQTVSQWLDAVSDFAADNRTSRLVYFHPHDIVYYPKAMQQWLSHAAALQRGGRFRWYTMTQLADFLNAREQTQWNESVLADSKKSVFEVTHPKDLAQQTWLLPRARYQQPIVETGTAQVSSDKTDWIVVAKSGKTLTFSANHVEMKQ